MTLSAELVGEFGEVHRNGRRILELRCVATAGDHAHAHTALQVGLKGKGVLYR